MPDLRLFGGASLEDEHGALTGPAAQRRRLALLALLGASHPSAMSREKLMAYLWPERDTEHGRNLLNQAVHAVRKAIGDGAILSAGDELRLGTDPLRCDVVEFRKAIAAGEPERAAELYAGPFLDGFFLADAPEFERWAAVQREAFRRDYQNLLEEMAHQAMARGDVQRAVDQWQRLAAEDPYSTRITLHLMEALEAAGDRAAAIGQGRIHAALLEQEFGAEPDPQVTALAERMRTEPAGTIGAEPRPEGAGAEAHAADPPTAQANPPAHESAREVVETRVPATGAPVAWQTRRSVLRPGSPLAIMGFAGLVIVLAAFWLREPRSPPLHAQRVVVALFENRTGDASLDPIGDMAADWITQGLAQTGAVDVVPASTALASARFVRAGMGQTPDLDPIRALAEETGAGIVISGAYYLQRDSIQFQAQIIDAQRRRVLWALEPLGAPADAPMSAIDTVRQRMLGALAPVLDVRLAGSGRFYHGRPPSYEAYRAYAEGWDHFLSGSWRDAIVQYERALDLDSSYLAPQLAMAWAYGNLREFARTDSIANALNRSRERLTPYELASLDLLIAAGQEDRLATYAAARRAAALAPGTLPHVQWGIEALRLNRPREAIRILSGIDPTRGVVRGSFTYWTGLAGARHALGHHRRELKAARRARALYPDEPRYLQLEAVALAALGRTAGIGKLVDARLALPEQRNPNPVAFMVRTGLELRAHGHPEAAHDLFDRAIEWYRGRPADERAAYRGDYATALHYVGHRQESEAVFRELATEIPEDMGVLGVLGMFAAERGDLDEAARIDARLAAHREPRQWGNHTFFRACVAAYMGRTEDAVSLLREAFAQGASYWPRPHFMPCFESLRDDPRFREMLRPKD